MSDLYDTDVVTWAETQAGLLRRRAAGELVNDTELDWANIAEEIEDVGLSELRAVTSALKVAMQHKLYVLGWPEFLSVRHWQAEVRIQLADAHEGYRESMRKSIKLETIYRRALLAVARHMIDAGPPPIALPDVCPWTLDELLAEGAAALRGPAMGNDAQ